MVRLDLLKKIILGSNPDMDSVMANKILKELLAKNMVFYVKNLKEMASFNEGFYMASRADLQMVHVSREHSAGKYLEAKGYVKFGSFAFLKSDTKNLAIINEGYKQVLLAKPKEGFQIFPLDNSQSQKGIGLDTGILSRDPQGS